MLLLLCLLQRSKNGIGKLSRYKNVCLTGTASHPKFLSLMIFPETQMPRQGQSRGAVAGGAGGYSPPSTKSVGNSQHYGTLSENFGKTATHRKSYVFSPPPPQKKIQLPLRPWVKVGYFDAIPAECHRNAYEKTSIID